MEQEPVTLGYIPSFPASPIRLMAQTTTSATPKIPNQTAVDLDDWMEPSEDERSLLSGSWCSDCDSVISEMVPSIDGNIYDVISEVCKECLFPFEESEENCDEEASRHAYESEESMTSAFSSSRTYIEEAKQLLTPAAASELLSTDAEKPRDAVQPVYTVDASSASGSSSFQASTQEGHNFSDISSKMSFTCQIADDHDDLMNCDDLLYSEASVNPRCPTEDERSLLSRSWCSNCDSVISEMVPSINGNIYDVISEVCQSYLDTDDTIDEAVTTISASRRSIQSEEPVTPASPSSPATTKEAKQVVTPPVDIAVDEQPSTDTEKSQDVAQPPSVSPSSASTPEEKTLALLVAPVPLTVTTSDAPSASPASTNQASTPEAQDLACFVAPHPLTVITSKPPTVSPTSSKQASTPKSKTLAIHVAPQPLTVTSDQAFSQEATKLVSQRRVKKSHRNWKRWGRNRVCPAPSTDESVAAHKVPTATYNLSCQTMSHPHTEASAEKSRSSVIRKILTKKMTNMPPALKTILGFKSSKVVPQ